MSLYWKVLPKPDNHHVYLEKVASTLVPQYHSTEKNRKISITFQTDYRQEHTIVYHLNNLNSVSGKCSFALHVSFFL